MAATENGYDPHPIIPQPETLGAFIPPQSNAELGGEQAAALWRAGLRRSMNDPQALLQFIQTLQGR